VYRRRRSDTVRLTASAPVSIALAGRWAANSRVVTRRLYAVRVGTRTGVGAAAVREVYLTSGLALPAGATVDELPSPTRVDARFGYFTVEWTIADGSVVRTTSLRVARAVVPPDDYADLRAFLEAERQPIVLRR
jgi:hypothetical protein